MLQSKVRSVLSVNPWIGGRLVSKTLVFPTQPNDKDVDAIVHISSYPEVVRTVAYSDLVTAIAKNHNLSVQTGAKTQNNGSRVTKLVVVRDETVTNNYAIVFSMSHVAADGHDYYKMFNMIAGDGLLQTVNPERIEEYERREDEWTGKGDFKWISGSLGLVKGMLGGLMCGPKSSWMCYEVDNDKVAVKKASTGVTAAIPFVSTNDVLTSHFGHSCGARVLMMVVNMRNRIPVNVTDNNAGCYESCLLLDPENYDDPTKIRACIHAGVPYTRQAASRPLPGVCESSPMALITSWASFKFSLTVEGLEEQLLHLPCMDMPDMMDVALVFKPRKDKLAVLYLAKRCNKDSLTGPDSVLGGALDATLFP
jgi:hypothetical protein